MSEESMWTYIRTRMGKSWDAQRHEDKNSLGIPDVSYGINGINGWIELKNIDKYPKRGKIRLTHFTREQRFWLKNRQKYGGNCWLLLRIAQDFFIFKGDCFPELHEGVNFSDILDYCHSKYFSADNAEVSFRQWFLPIISKYTL